MTKFKCINKDTGEEIKKGDTVTTFRGEKHIVESFEPPHKPSASGKIYCKGQLTGYYARVYNCEYVREQ